MSDDILKEERMKDQRDRFLAFSFASADLFLEISEEGRITHALGAAKGLTGIDEKSIIGKKWLELFSVYEQATMIHLRERAKPGVRIGPVLINLSDTMGGRKAIMTAIKMPGSNKIYITLGLSSAIMARIAHALSENQGFEILTKEVFMEAAQAAVARARRTGQEIGLTFFDFAPTRLDRTRMGEPAWKKVREALTEFLIAEAFDGYSAGEIFDGRFSLIHDKKISAEVLRDKMTALSKQNDPSGQGLVIKVKHLSIDAKTLEEREAERAVRYAVAEFEQHGAAITLSSLNAALQNYVSTNAPKVKEFQAMLERSGFGVHFQPVVDIQSNQAAHFEMFCNFESGSTREWVKFAEDVGLSSKLDMAMCDRAIHHVKFKAGGTWTKFSLNLSPRSLEDKEFVQTLLERLEGQKSLGERLLFEITESTTIHNHQEFIKFITDMRNLGFKIALDHFSPEPTYIELLSKFKPDFVKIDGKFIRRILTSQRDAEMVRSLIELCQGQNIEVIAKWVEERGQLQRLTHMGANYGQGFYFGKLGPKPEYFPPKD